MGHPLNLHPPIARVGFLGLTLAACAHTQSVGASSAAAVAATSDPAVDPTAPVTVGFVGDPGMSHLAVGLVVWRGGVRDAHVQRVGRFAGQCGEAVYQRTLHHPVQPPVVLALGCDPTGLVDTPVVQVVEVVREPAAVVVRTADAPGGQLGTYTEAMRVEVPAGVPVTAATPVQVQAAQAEVHGW